LFFVFCFLLFGFWFLVFGFWFLVFGFWFFSSFTFFRIIETKNVRKVSFYKSQVQEFPTFLFDMKDLQFLDLRGFFSLSLSTDSHWSLLID